MVFARLASAARTCISPGVMRSMRRRAKREEPFGEGRDGAEEEESATVGSVEATAVEPVVESRVGNSARSPEEAAAGCGACEARGQRRRSWARRSRACATSSLAATRGVRFVGLAL